MRALHTVRSPATDYNDPAVLETIVVQYKAHVQELATRQAQDSSTGTPTSQTLYTGRDAVLKDGIDLEIEAEVARRLNLKAESSSSRTTVGGHGEFASDLGQFYADYIEGAQQSTVGVDASGSGACKSCSTSLTPPSRPLCSHAGSLANLLAHSCLQDTACPSCPRTGVSRARDGGTSCPTLTPVPLSWRGTGMPALTSIAAFRACVHSWRPHWQPGASQRKSR